MSRATTKNDLIKSASENFDKLWSIINAMSDKQQAAEFDYGDEKLDEAFHWKRDRNLRDVLTHLYEWHQLLLNWVDNNMKGVAKPFLLEPYNWKNYQEMNVVFFDRHQNTSFEKSKEMLKDSHKTVLALIEKFSNDELFSKSHFKWTGTTSLGAYCISATASHYDWAIKKLKVWNKAYNKK